MDGCHSPVTHTQYSLSAEHAPLTHSIPVPMHCICCTHTHFWRNTHCTIGVCCYYRPTTALGQWDTGVPSPHSKQYKWEVTSRSPAHWPPFPFSTPPLVISCTHTSHHSCSRSPPQNIPPFVSLLSERDIQANKHPSLPISRLVQFVSLGHGPQQHQNEWLDHQMSLGQSVYALWATLNQAANITAWNSANVCSPFAFLVLPAIFGRWKVAVRLIDKWTIRGPPSSPTLPPQFHASNRATKQACGARPRSCCYLSISRWAYSTMPWLHIAFYAPEGASFCRCEWNAPPPPTTHCDCHWLLPSPHDTVQPSDSPQGWLAHKHTDGFACRTQGGLNLAIVKHSFMGLHHWLVAAAAAAAASASILLLILAHHFPHTQLFPMFATRWQ